MPEPMYFQWQNEVLCKTVYPMREPKLRDFLLYYMEIDLWKQYKGKDIVTLKADVDAYIKAQELGHYHYKLIPHCASILCSMMFATIISSPWTSRFAEINNSRPIC
jgi:hypothetical protein